MTASAAARGSGSSSLSIMRLGPLLTVLLAAPATKRARCMPAAPRTRTHGGFAGPRRRADTARATSEL
eukprot:12036615-Alexandrium_andersonii.AAC.1